MPKNTEEVEATGGRQNPKKKTRLKKNNAIRRG